MILSRVVTKISSRYGQIPQEEGGGGGIKQLVLGVSFGSTFLPFSFEHIVGPHSL